MFDTQLTGIFVKN